MASRAGAAHANSASAKRQLPLTAVPSVTAPAWGRATPSITPGELRERPDLLGVARGESGPRVRRERECIDASRSQTKGRIAPRHWHQGADCPSQRKTRGPDASHPRMPNTSTARVVSTRGAEIDIVAHAEKAAHGAHAASGIASKILEPQDQTTLLRHEGKPLAQCGSHDTARHVRGVGIVPLERVCPFLVQQRFECRGGLQAIAPSRHPAGVHPINRMPQNQDDSHVRTLRHHSRGDIGGREIHRGHLTAALIGSTSAKERLVRVLRPYEAGRQLRRCRSGSRIPVARRFGLWQIHVGMAREILMQRRGAGATGADHEKVRPTSFGCRGGRSLPHHVVGHDCP